MALSKKDMVEMYRRMLLVRYFEEKVDELYGLGKIKGGTHLYAGEEAVAIGACAAIKPDDYITSTHRGHGHCVGKGGDPKLMMAELWGKKTGYCKGKGGSLHIADLSSNNLGANGIVGGGIPIATGAGLSIQMKKSKQVVLCFFGDGASNTGSFHESLNMGGVWKLPVVYICENNLYGMSVPAAKACAAQPDIAIRAASYGMPGQVADGMDVLAVYEAVKKAADRARKGSGPTLIECKTYRYKGHSKSDPRAYRTREEEAEWQARDAILSFRKKLVEKDVLTEKEAERINNEAYEYIEASARFAEESPYPDVSELLEDVYVN